MRRVNLVLNDFDAILKGDIIGVDYGALVCLRKGLNMTLACGDFDSIQKTDLAIIKEQTERVDVLDPIKDMTDFTYALTLCDDYDEIHVYGALGKRRDHEYVHLLKVIQDPRLILFDDNNIITSLKPGHYEISKQMRYFSIIVVEEGVLNLSGFKYPLKDRMIHRYDDYLTSNEILDHVGSVTLHSGQILIIQSQD